MYIIVEERMQARYLRYIVKNIDFMLYNFLIFIKTIISGGKAPYIMPPSGFVVKKVLIMAARQDKPTCGIIRENKL